MSIRKKKVRAKQIVARCQHSHQINSIAAAQRSLHNVLKHRKDNRRHRQSVACAAVVILALIVVFIDILQNSSLLVSRYSQTIEGLQSPIRIVQLSDLHNTEFGKNNARLIAKVAAQQPQLILMTGDLVDRDDVSTEQAETLIRGLCDIAPVYISPGNHEAEYEKRYGADLRDRFTAAGAVVLDREWIDLELDGQQIRLGGINGYCVPRRHTEGNREREAEADFVEAFTDTDRLKLLMCHMPYTWLVLDGLEEWDIDCVFCGHVHGGQVRLPFIGGLWAPDQGWFPGKVSGLYLSNDETRAMLLSRGLGSSVRLPRFNNFPEIIVLDIVSAD